MARKVVGVGSVGTRCWIGLLEGPSHRVGDRIVLQVKEAQPSVLEPYVGDSTLGHHGRRVVVGQRLTQAASDVFLGWGEGARSGYQYYVRQLWDVKGQGDPMTMDVNNLGYYGALCGGRSPERTPAPAIRCRSPATWDRPTCSTVRSADFAERYAAVNEDDHAMLLDAIKDGRVEASAPR